MMASSVGPAAAGVASPEARAVAAAKLPVQTIVGATGQAVVPNFVMDPVNPRKVLVDDIVTWTWTAPADGRYDFDTHGSEVDTVLAVRPQSGRAGSGKTTQNDDVGDVTTSAVVIVASEGQTFQISVRAKHRQTGLVTLSWSEGVGVAQPKQGRAAPSQSTFVSIPASTNTGEKPQSKAWHHDGAWWVVLGSAGVSPAGTWVWKLEGERWRPEVMISPSTAVRADVQTDGDLTHVLLHGPSTSLVSLKYDGAGLPALGSASGSD